MQIAGRVLLMAVCLLSATALPNFSQETTDSLVQLLLAQVRTSLIDTRAMTPGETACANDYNNRTQTANNHLTNQTNMCFDGARNMTITNNEQQNATTNITRHNLLIVQHQLANCSALFDVPSFLKCTVETFDSNLSLLDNSNTLAYQVQAEIAGQQNQVDIVRTACINQAMSAAKTNLTLTTNIYNTCLNNIKKQRDMTSPLLLN